MIKIEEVSEFTNITIMEIADLFLDYDFLEEYEDLIKINKLILYSMNDYKNILLLSLDSECNIINTNLLSTNKNFYSTFKLIKKALMDYGSATTYICKENETLRVIEIIADKLNAKREDHGDYYKYLWEAKNGSKEESKKGREESKKGS